MDGRKGGGIGASANNSKSGCNSIKQYSLSTVAEAWEVAKQEIIETEFVEEVKRKGGVRQGNCIEGRVEVVDE